MSAPARGVLYSRDMLALAVELAQFPHDETAALQAEARSRTCGSTLRLSASQNNGLIGDIGLSVTACAVGQAAAAIFATAGAGRSPGDIAAAERAIAAWLGAGAERPDWPRIERLEAARDYPARHEAILLPWRAALAALSNPPGRG